MDVPALWSLVAALTSATMGSAKIEYIQSRMQRVTLVILWFNVSHYFLTDIPDLTICKLILSPFLIWVVLLYDNTQLCWIQRVYASCCFC